MEAQNPPKVAACYEMVLYLVLVSFSRVYYVKSYFEKDTLFFSAYLGGGQNGRNYYIIT